MAGDAIEGAVYLTSQGGEVWAQDPASCVVSSMVDGARARGVVEYIGSPRDLAERCVAQYGKG
jgi:chemotaxis response regulator CheB